MSETSTHDTSQPPLAAAEHTIDAVYEDGVIRPAAPLHLPPGTPLQLRIETRNSLVATARPARTRRFGLPHIPLPQTAPRLFASVTWLEISLLALGLAIYVLTRAVGLSRFPIYFFSDEAILVVRAEELLRNGLRTADGTLLPTYMRNADRWNLGLPIYLHLASLALFGKSVVVARATSAAVSLVGALAVAATLKLVFHNRFWWSGVLVMAVIPAWFLHSRTAFDPVIMAAFYACFLCAYLLYRYRSPRYLFAAIVFAAMACYSYPNGQAVMLASVVLLLISDLRYHLRQSPRLLLKVGLLGAVLVLPLLRFRLEQPGAWEDQLRVLNSYVVQPIPLRDKLVMFSRLYAQGLKPSYWFFPNNADWVRHRWYGLGHLGQFLLPFVVIGLGRCLWCWRSSAHRAVLIAVLAAPTGAALYEIAITRALAMVVPAALLAVIGLGLVYDWLQRVRRPVPHTLFAAGTAAVLSLISISMLRAALVNGPTWYSDYGLYGMQYGAQQVFGAVREELASSPDTRVLVSHTWANNPNIFSPFFLNDSEQGRVEITTLEPFMVTRREIGEDWVFVLTAQEYAQAQASGKFEIESLERVVRYPDGKPGFYFVRLRYSLAADAIFAAERAARQQLVESTVSIHGQTVAVRHSQIDEGEIGSLFDGDTATIIRGVEANPLVLEFHFPTPLTLHTISIDGWSRNIDLTVEITPPDQTTTKRFTASYREPSPDPHVEFTLPNGPQQASVLRLEVANAGEGEVSKVHVREVRFHEQR